MNPDYSDITAETRSLNVSDEELSRSADGLSLIATKFSQRSKLVKTQLNRWASKFIATCEINASPVITNTGQCAGFQIARYGQSLQTDIAELLRIGADRTEITAETDCIMVRRASELAFQENQTEAPLTVVDVHYSTLRDQSYREKFLDACRSVKEVCVDSLIIRIIYSSDRLPSHRFRKVVNRLEPLFQSRILDIRKPGLRNLNFQAWRIPIISMNSREFEPALIDCGEAIRRFFQTIHASRFRLLVDQVSNQEVGKNIFDLGADFVSFRDPKVGS